MTPTEFKKWLSAQLQEIEPHIGGPATPEFAAVVADAKFKAYCLEYHDLALSLPDTEKLKTALACCNQLKRCLKALEVPAAELSRDTLTPPEVAKFLKVSPDKVLNWIRAGQLRASNLSQGNRPRWAVSKPDLEIFLKTKQPEPRPAPKKKTLLRPGAVRRYS